MAKGGMVAKNLSPSKVLELPCAVERVLVSIYLSVEAVHVSLCPHTEVNFGSDVCRLADLSTTCVPRPGVAVAEPPVAHGCVRV